MELAALLSSQETAQTRMQIEALNKSLGNPANAQTLDKDDFLKILVTQLTHQDPTEPMKDTEFIAQMAQFSSLEQMTNMSQDFGKLAGILSTSQALGLLGRIVDIVDGDAVITGVVEEVAGREAPRVLVNGRYFNFDKVEKIRE
ncbi:MAG: flagellar hook assembly protein FlgD [Spirochaetales bacterium]|nr:flagellar hook assembly protein FlgD [Spirochaetales bacterium]